MLKFLLLVRLLTFEDIQPGQTAEIITGEIDDDQSATDLEYCFVNDSLIKRKVDGAILHVIDDTGDWLVASNDTDTLKFPVNGSDCNSSRDDDYNPDIAIYAVRVSTDCIIILLVIGIIALHLLFKELQTVSGVLIIMKSFISLVVHIIGPVRSRYQFTHRVNDSGEICAILLYIRAVLLFLSQLTSFTILLHFTYLMYKTYQMRAYI